MKRSKVSGKKKKKKESKSQQTNPKLQLHVQLCVHGKTEICRKRGSQLDEFVAALMLI